MSLANRRDDGPQTKVPDDHPLNKAWLEWQKSAEYANTIKWAGESNKGNLWAAFCAGFSGGVNLAAES